MTKIFFFEKVRKQSKKRTSTVRKGLNNGKPVHNGCVKNIAMEHKFLKKGKCATVCIEVLDDVSKSSKFALCKTYKDDVSPTSHSLNT